MGGRHIKPNLQCIVAFEAKIATYHSHLYKCPVLPHDTMYIVAATVNEDYLEFEMNITFVSGQNATGDNQQCFYVVLLDDNILEYNETFDILIRPSPEDEDIVNITNGIITVTIEEDSTDSKIMYRYHMCIVVY